MGSFLQYADMGIIHAIAHKYPPDFLPGLNDGWYWDRYQTMKIVLATGEQDICLSENRRLADIMDAQRIPHWLDVMGRRSGPRLALVAADGAQVSVVAHMKETYVV